MPYTQSDLDAIDKAIGSGATSVDMPTLGRVTYRSLAEMRAIRTTIAQAVAAAASPTTTPTRRLKIYSTKDL